MKKNYLLSIIVIGLITLSLYSTYAMFTVSIETNDIVKLSASTLPTSTEIVEYERVTIGSNEKKTIEFTVTNNTNGSLYYGVWYEMINPTSINDSIIIGKKEDTLNDTLGQLSSNSNAKVSFIIENKTSSSIIINIGVGYSTTSSLNLPTNRYLITEIYLNNLDESGANPPDLLEGLIPIMYKEEKWVKADEANKQAEYQWYDYDSQMWANAVLVTDASRTTYENAELGTEINESDVLAYYVWVPRYKYKLFNAKKTAGVDSYSARTAGIDIVFESGTLSTGTVSCTVANDGTESCENAENGEYYTHPAFTFGEVELTGIWVGKFELTGSTTTPTIKPNVSSLRNISVSTIYNTIAKISESSNAYGTNSMEADSHMMKNMEWGAVAYLSNSKYGRCIDGSCTEIGINNNSSYTTGCGAAPGSGSSSSCNAYTTETGMLASTTGNVYGIYDMSGGAYEYVMGNMVNSSGNFYASNSGFSSAPEIKYYDKYPYSTSTTAGTRGHLGDATSEVVVSGNTGWNSDYAYFVYSNYPWFYRGGGYNYGSGSGAFNLYDRTGYADSFGAGRAVLVRRD